MLKKLIPQSRYARNVITLMTGTGLAQAIPIAISPILTRLYTPEDFGIFALFMAIASIASVLVTGRYELAIMLPKSDSDAFHIVALSVGLSFVISTLLLLLIVVFNSQITSLLGTREISNWLYWGPVSTLLMGIYTSLNYWSNRKSQYRRLAISRIVQTASSSVPHLAAGLMKSGPLGLVGGQLAGQFIASSVIARLIYREEKDQIQKLRWARVFVQARKYKDFPRFLIVAHGFNTASAQVPVILLGALFSTVTAGYYTLIQRVMGAPIVLLARSLGDVFRQEASQAYASSGNCQVIYLRTLKRLIGIAIIPFSLFFLFSVEIFEWFFGDAWRIAGEYSKILVPMFFLKFIFSPLSIMDVIAEKQKLDLLWQVILLILLLASFFLGYQYFDVETSLLFFSCSYSFMYLISGYISYGLSRGRWQ